MIFIGLICKIYIDYRDSKKFYIITSLIILSWTVWGRHLSSKCVLFECDNSSLVSAVNISIAQESRTQCTYYATFGFFVAYFDIDIKYRHIAGVNYHTADFLSRNNLAAFFCLYPQAHHHPTSLPRPLLQMLEAGRPDWTSPQFRQLFSFIIRRV